MKFLAIDFTITADTVISFAGLIVAILIPFIGGVYAIVTNTKRYELSETYRNELFAWYSECVSVMMEIINAIESGFFFREDYQMRKHEMISSLSAKIEIGRFYFPNKIKDDGYGDWKNSAYRGYRHLYLEFIFHFYKIAKTDNCVRRLEDLKELERLFTSGIYDVIKPRKRVKKYMKYTDLALPEGKLIEDYIFEHKEHMRFFLK